MLVRSPPLGHGVEGFSPGRRVQEVVPCGLSSESDYPFENLHHLVSEPEASSFSHAISVEIQNNQKVSF